MSLWKDICFGARTLAKAPGFTITAVLTMAFGIGATTAIFSVADAMLWKPLPLPHLSSLTMILERVPDDPNDYNWVTTADLQDIRRDNTSLENLAYWGDGLANIVGASGEPERVSQYLVSANFFDVLGVQPARGRGFLPGEDQHGRDREVLLSDALWRRRFAADPGIVGRAIRLDDMDYLVIGVMPANFEFPKTAELWTPLVLAATARNDRQGFRVMPFGHLKSARTEAELNSELQLIGGRLAREFPMTNRNRVFLARNAHRFLIGEYNRQYVLMLLGAVIFVLLIACVNVANLQFAHFTGRLREVAVRAALGASRRQIVTQLLTESMLLSFAGAALGLLIAAWGVDAIHAGMPPEVGKFVMGWNDMGLDGRALFFTIAAAALSGLFAGLIPAWQSSRPNLTDALREGGRGASMGQSRQRLRGILVAAEVALAVVLLVGASLMVRGFSTLAHAANNMEPSSLLSLRLALTETKYKDAAQRRAFYNDVLDRIHALPGARSVVAVTAMPYSSHSSGRSFAIEGRPLDPAKPVAGMYQLVTPGFFEMLHVPLIAGRLLDSRDGPDSPRTAVISERAAHRYWPNEPYPIGQRIKIKDGENKSEWITIVGVAGDIMHDVFDRNPRAVFYMPYAQDPRLWMDIGVRAAGDPMRLQPAVVAAVRSIDPAMPVTEIRTVDTLMRYNAMGLIYVAVLMGVFGVLALALSCIGVYGVMAYLVQEQTHEIGIRMALGARQTSVLAMIFRRGMGNTILGLAAGLVLAYGLAMLLQNLVWGVTASDPISFVGIPAALLLSAALAIYIPAYRAIRVDPIIALRYE